MGLAKSGRRVMTVLWLMRYLAFSYTEALHIRLSILQID